jgi:hypothetical protein
MVNHGETARTAVTSGSRRPYTTCEVLGLPGAESVGPGQGGRMLRQLVVLRGPRTAPLTCLGPADVLRNAEADRFFASSRFPS